MGLITGIVLGLMIVLSLVGCTINLYQMITAKQIKDKVLFGFFATVFGICGSVFITYIMYII